MGADLVVVAPSEPPVLRSDLEVDLFAKYSGQHKVLIPIDFVNSEFHAYVYRPEGVNRSESRSGRISLRWKLADGSSAERIRWRILGAGSSKYGVGDAELELGPGSYVVQPVQRALARKGFDIEASERAEVVFELPDSVVSCAFRLATPRGLVAVPKDTTIIIERGDNVVESYRTSEEAESIDLWLPPGRFHVTMYAPSYDVPEAWVDILANERGDMQKQVLKLYARDL